MNYSHISPAAFVPLRSRLWPRTHDATRRLQAGCRMLALLTAVSGLLDQTALATVPFVVAHRGDSGHAPENTLAAIDLAVGVADMTEFDVQISADGELVLMHDSTVNRTTNGRGRVSSLTLAELETLDAGAWFSSSFIGEPVPTLGEAMNAATEGNLEPFVEQKSGTAADYHEAFEMLGYAPDEFRVISFSWSFLDDMNALNAEYHLGALGSGGLNQRTIDRAVASGADFIDWHHSAINQATVDLVHANGMELHVYTVDSPMRMQELIALGVDGITTNDPGTLAALLAVPEPPLASTLLAASGCFYLWRWPRDRTGRSRAAWTFERA